MGVGFKKSCSLSAARLRRSARIAAFGFLISALFCTPPRPVLAHGDAEELASSSSGLAAEPGAKEEESLGDVRRASSPQARLYASKAHSLGNGSVLTVVAPPEWSKVGSRLAQLLTQSQSRFEDLFGPIPAFSVTLRLLDEETFFLSTGAPRWTNALFYRGQIIIPISSTEPIDFENIARSVRHEYTHAVIHALSGGKAPGWIDEGLAQLAEGSENPALRPALYDYLRESPPVPFQLMQGGFTRLDTDMVAAAYAQSLIASQALVETFGYERISVYFSRLRAGETHERSFERIFGIREASFEDRFNRKLSRWANTYEVMNRSPEYTRQEPSWANQQSGELVKARGF